jgi:hypothetical protein
MSAFLSVLRRAPVLVGVTMTLALGGCASIMQGTTQQVSLSSSPSGASITVNGRALGTTPAAVDLKRKDNHVIRIELDGYQPYEVALARSVSGWVWGNIVFGGLPGLAVDAITGGLYKLSPEQVMASLASEAPALSELDDDQLYIMVTLFPLPDWQLLDYLEEE